MMRTEFTLGIVSDLFSQPQLIVPFGHFCQMSNVQTLWVQKYAGRLIFIVSIHPVCLSCN